MHLSLNLNPFFAKKWTHFLQKVNPFCKMNPLGFCILFIALSQQKEHDPCGCALFVYKDGGIWSREKIASAICARGRSTRWHQTVRWTVCRQGRHGRKSRHPHHERNLFCLPRQERFFLAFRGKIQQKQVKLAQNRGWNGWSDRASPCFLLFGGQTGVILFVFLRFAKKSVKQHTTWFEWKKYEIC